MVASPFVPIDKQAVIGALQAVGSRDPDVIHARVRGLVAWCRLPQHAGLAIVSMGLGLALGFALYLAGVAGAIVGWWLWWRGRKNVAVVEAAFSEFFRGPL